MDSIVNQYPGNVDYYDPNYRSATVYKPEFTTCYGTTAITALDMNRGTKGLGMYYYAEFLNGYYEYVGKGKGVYAIKEKPSGRNLTQNNGISYVNNIVMVSKYLDKTKNTTVIMIMFGWKMEL